MTRREAGRRSGLALVVAAALGLSACGGGGATTETAISNTTVSKGQALIDLKRALDTGAISKDEYERQRKKILAE